MVRKRRGAAEEVCWCLFIMMALGALEIPQHMRDEIWPVFQKWVDLAAATGVMCE